MSTLTDDASDVWYRIGENIMASVTALGRHLDQRIDVVTAGQARLEAGQAELKERVGVLEVGQVELKAGQVRLEAGQVELKERVGVLEAGQARLEAGQADLKERVGVLEVGQARLEAGQAELSYPRLYGAS